MLKAVASVRDEVLRQCAADKIDLQVITNVFTGLTIVDQIAFVGYEVPRENPIWGEFTRWSRQPGVYRSFETIVEIRYAKHLSEAERRFVVCKELCHALDTEDGVCDVSTNAMNNLVDGFSLISAGNIKKLSPVMTSELIAHSGALELLCPLQVRKEILQNNGKPDDEMLPKIAEKYLIPEMQLLWAFDEEHIKAMEWLLSHS